MKSAQYAIHEKGDAVSVKIRHRLFVYFDTLEMQNGTLSSSTSTTRNPCRISSSAVTPGPVISFPENVPS